MKISFNHKMNFCLSLSFLIFCFNVCLSFSGDEVTQLPGINYNTTFRHYSGYLTVGKGRYMHYWFVESQSKPEKDPLILWLTGGPGCSSLIGLLSENGPFRVVNDGKTIVENPHSWNTLANVLYLESPVGVGFSYDTNSNEISDESTADDNYSALQRFFEKFPQFSNNSFYITGESYAGIYIPMLAHKIFQDNSTINLKGVAIGNGALDHNIYPNTRVHMAYTHGLIDTIEYNNLVENCCKCSVKGAQVCDFENRNSKVCNAAERLRSNIVRNGINAYNIYTDCKSLQYYSEDSHYHFSLKTHLGFSSREINAHVHSAIAQTAPTQSTNTDCVDYGGYKNYLNTPEVRKALHIPQQLNTTWDQCSTNVEKRYKKQYPSMKSQVLDIIEKYKIGTFIVYNGDIDIVCDFLGDQQFVDELGLKLIQKYKKWTVGGRTAGFVKRFEGISFMTVRNAGHMVPTDQPESALAIIKELIGVSKVV